MYTCKNCGQTYSDPVKFCGKCGGNSFETQQQAANYQQAGDYNASYTNPAPAYTYDAAPAPVAASKAPAIIGMVFGIIATIFGIICIAMAAEAIDSADYYRYYYDYDYYSYYYSSSYYISNIREAAYSVFIGCSVFSVPSIIVGLIMSFKNSGIKAMSIVGRVTSFLGLGLWIIGLIMIGNI